MSVSNLFSPNDFEIFAKTANVSSTLSVEGGLDVVSSVLVQAETNATGVVIGNPSLQFSGGTPFIRWNDGVGEILIGANDGNAGIKMNTENNGTEGNIGVFGSITTGNEGIVGLSEVAGATLGDATAPINTDSRKSKGALVYNSSDDEVYVATGGTPTSPWKLLSSGTPITPA